MLAKLRRIGFKRIGIAGAVVLAAVIVGFGIYIFVWFQRNVPDTYADINQHFKYGSFGGEAEMIPYWIWRVLPAVFPEYLPDFPGEGYARFGFIYDTDTPKEHPRPIGISYREGPIAQMGFSCAACHTGTFRESRDAPRKIILGMPAHQLNTWDFQLFFFNVAKDDRFNADTLIPAIREVNPEFSWLDSLVYRFFVIPGTKDGLLERAEALDPVTQRGPWGLGRADTFAPHKYVLFDLPDEISGLVDFPSLWDQEARKGMWLHWDGNNNSVQERNKIAAISAGATEDSLDLAGLQRTEDWIFALKPPDFPLDRIDWSRYESGHQIYQTSCSVCHALNGSQVGQVTPIEEIGTDRARFDSFTQELADKINTIGAGRPWAFSHHRKSDGYANVPLDGIWLRAPYLHNGSVPTLRDLLKPSEDRPKIFYSGYDVYDFDNVGFVSAGPEAERLGFRFDTAEVGNGNLGHEYGTNLSQQEIDDLLEFLKTQ